MKVSLLIIWVEMKIIDVCRTADIVCNWLDYFNYETVSSREFKTLTNIYIENT